MEAASLLELISSSLSVGPLNPIRASCDGAILFVCRRHILMILADNTAASDFVLPTKTSSALAKREIRFKLATLSPAARG